MSRRPAGSNSACTLQSCTPTAFRDSFSLSGYGADIPCTLAEACALRCVCGVACRYDGEWHEDKMHGHGTYFYRDTGDTYEGGFVHGAREGRGKYTKADGTVTEGEWKANELVAAA